ncbi:MAG: potassium channel family protein [Vulcanococcus sp.]
MHSLLRPNQHKLQRQRHRGYRHLLATCLVVIFCLMLPRGLRQLSSLGYLAMPWVLLTALGHSVTGERWSLLRTRLYRLLCLVTFAASLGWYGTTALANQAGLPLLFLWALLVAWSCERLIRNLSVERSINRHVLMGALAGYLLLGLAAGLLFSVLETVSPGSFASTIESSPSVLHWHGTAPTAQTQVWAVDFVALNYYAFTTLTTTGYGDIHPLTPQAQMSSVMVAITGTVYLALVMGLLISRYTAQDVEEEIASPQQLDFDDEG